MGVEKRLVEEFVSDIYAGESPEKIGWEPFFYLQDLLKLVVTYDIEKFLGKKFVHHYHGVNRNLLIKYKEAINHPFSSTFPWGINPSILRGEIFAVIGNICSGDEKRIEKALHEADPETVVVFWNTDGKYHFLPSDKKLLNNITSIQILKIPEEGSAYPESTPEYIYIYISDKNAQWLLSQYRFELRLEHTSLNIHAAPVNLQGKLLSMCERNSYETQQTELPEEKNRILIWIVDETDEYCHKALDVLLKKQNGLLAGMISSKEESIEYDSKVINSVPEQKISSIAHDIILAVTKKNISFMKLSEKIKALGGEPSKLLMDRVVCIPGFSYGEYKLLRDSNLSILSMNCFGGIVSHTLSLPFRSPLINMYFFEDGYIKFLRDPRGYLQKELVLDSTGFNSDLNINYPIYRLGDVIIHMNHYDDFAEAKQKFKERTQRINWNNICVVMYTDSVKVLEEFDRLPYVKKVCFTTQKTLLKSACYIEPSIDVKYGAQPLWWKVNRYGKGVFWYYDIFSLLSEGKKLPLLY